MSISKEEYFNLGIGDKVRLANLETLKGTRGFASTIMDRYAETKQVIRHISDDEVHFDGVNFYFAPEAIEEVLEHNAEKREMSFGVFANLKAGDLIEVDSYDFICNHWFGNRAMAEYGGSVVKFKSHSDDRTGYIVDDRQCYVWKYDMFRYKVLKYTPPTEEEIREALEIKEYKHEIKFNSSNMSSFEYLNQMNLIKVTNCVDDIIRAGNSKRFAEYLAGKWVIVSNYCNRIYNNVNPHIDAGLKFLKCSNWQLDGWRYIADEIKTLTESNHVSKRILDINFETGEIIDVLLTDKTRCCMCGEKLENVEHYGRYCTECLTSNGGFAYRFGYHSYNDGYKVLEKVDTKKTLVFGCEIERDYILSANKTGAYFGSSLKSAMLDIIRETQGDQLDNGTLRREQVFMSDGSLHQSGLEWITFPHTFDWYVQNKDKLDMALKSIHQRGFKDSQLAGNHIHMNRDFFTNKNGKNTAMYCASKIAVLFSKYWEGFCAIARRTKTRYAQIPNQKFDDDVFTIVEKTLNQVHKHEASVNLQHSDTIEIRLWSAIRGVDDLLFFLDNMQALARYVKKCGLETIQKAKFTDFMKYYKLPTSLGVVKNRLRRKPMLKHLYEEVCALESKKKGAKK